MRQSQRTDRSAEGVAGITEGVAVRLLCAAAILHVTLAVAVYASGRFALMPAAFDEGGVAVSFASDGLRHRAGARELSESLRRGEVRDWLVADRPVHVKLYAVCFALFADALGYSVLGAEPLNACLYLACLALVFLVGREVFGRRAGLWAACAVALWPSFLLHTTQFLKDPLFVAETLALALILVRLLTREHAWAKAVLTGIAGALVTTLLWLTRADMGELLLASVLFGALALAARQFRERRVLVTNVVALTLVAAAALLVPRAMPGALRLGPSPSSVRWTAEREALRRGNTNERREESARADLLTRAAARVGGVRQRFIEMYPDSGSNVDGDVRIDAAADLLRYIPRAAVVGFLAPFPSMWLAEGKQVGSAGRLLSAAETLAMYFVEMLALLGLWRARRSLAAWLLFSIAATGIIALGLVVVNVGTLYRLRYVFVMLLIVLAAEGFMCALDAVWKRGRVEAEGGAAA